MVIPARSWADIDLDGLRGVHLGRGLTVDGMEWLMVLFPSPVGVVTISPRRFGWSIGAATREPGSRLRDYIPYPWSLAADATVLRAALELLAERRP